MQNVWLPLVFTVFHLLGHASFAASPNSKCFMTMQDTARNAQIEMTPMGNGCAIYVTPVRRDSMIYRSYLFTDDGLFQVFNSYGNGAEGTKTGARVFALLPRTRKVGFQISMDQSSIRVQTSHADAMFKIRTSPQIAIDAVSGSEFQEDQRIAAENNGGLELTKNHFFYLDAGFGRGAAPQSDSKSHSTFHDTEGRQCVVSNQKVFTYKDGDARLRSDKALRRLLASNCPSLKRF